MRAGRQTGNAKQLGHADWRTWLYVPCSTAIYEALLIIASFPISLVRQLGKAR
jgi:hypothetical protein